MTQLAATFPNDETFSLLDNSAKCIFHISFDYSQRVRKTSQRYLRSTTVKRFFTGTSRKRYETGDRNLQRPPYHPPNIVIIGIVISTRLLGDFLIDKRKKEKKKIESVYLTRRRKTRNERYDNPLGLLSTFSSKYR